MCKTKLKVIRRLAKQHKNQGEVTVPAGILNRKTVCFKGTFDPESSLTSICFLIIRGNFPRLSNEKA